MAMNYLSRGFGALEESLLSGVLLYFAIIALLYALKIRRGFSWKCVFEMLFCIYGIVLLKITGIFELDYSLGGIISYNLIPFIGSSFIPVLLNFLLFVPYGFLLPVIFPSCRWSWKKIALAGGLASLTVELLQMFGGRYAEIDDFLVNTSGALFGFLLFSCMAGLKKNRKKALVYLVSACLALTACFAGIYAVGNNEEELPDGLYAAASHIAAVHVYFNGEMRTAEAESDVYNFFASQLTNCGGHILEAESISENSVLNNGCFIEILYDSPQCIRFDNADRFQIENAARLLYNADRNMLYWGDSSYKYCLDYEKMGESLKEHKAEILEEYARLPLLIRDYFD